MTTGKQLKARAGTPTVGISKTNYALVSGLSNATGVTCTDIIDKAVERYIKTLFADLK